MEKFTIGYEPGWTGAFTRYQADGAIPNGSAIVKCDSEEGDGTPDGTPGIVLGSMRHPEVLNGAFLYFVEWAAHPRVAVACAAPKLRMVLR